jgi:hypothetical protein
VFSRAPERRSYPTQSKVSNFLFLNILHLNYLFALICRESPRYTKANHNKINALLEGTKKNIRISSFHALELIRHFFANHQSRPSAPA